MYRAIIEFSISRMHIISESQLHTYRDYTETSVCRRLNPLNIILVAFWRHIVSTAALIGNINNTQLEVVTIFDSTAAMKVKFLFKRDIPTGEDTPCCTKRALIVLIGTCFARGGLLLQFRIFEYCCFREHISSNRVLAIVKGNF